MGWQFHPGVEVTHIFAACILKLSCSSDDLAWLTPFLTHNPYLGFAYLLAMEMVVAIAIGLATAGSAILDELTEEGAYWDTDRILGLVSAICLSIFACLLFLEYMYDDDDDESECEMPLEPIEVYCFSKRDPGSPGRGKPVAEWSVEDVANWWKANLPAMAQNQLSFILDCEIDGSDLLSINEEMLMDVGMMKLVAKKTVSKIDTLRYHGVAFPPTKYGDRAEGLDAPLNLTGEKRSKASKFTPLRVITVSLMGSFDDMAIQASVLKGGDLLWYQLVIGIGLGASVVVSICLFLSSFKQVQDCLKNIPVFLIIGLFAIYCFICTFLP